MSRLVFLGFIKHNLFNHGSFDMHDRVMQFSKGSIRDSCASWGKGMYLWGHGKSLQGNPKPPDGFPTDSRLIASAPDCLVKQHIDRERWIHKTISAHKD